LEEKLLKVFIEEISKVFFRGEARVKHYMACATGFGFGDKYCLNWQRGTKIRMVQAHVRLTVVILVDATMR
jgi:hypothetical protein